MEKRSVPAAVPPDGSSPGPRPPRALVTARPCWWLRMEEWLERRQGWMAGLILLLSLVLRAIYFVQAEETPLYSTQKWAVCDMEFFDQWARHLAAGDWWGEEVLHPYHTWHRLFAEGTFQAYPEATAAYRARHTDASGQVDLPAAYRDFINDIYQGRVFHQEPLYPYLVAVTYRLFGPDIRWVGLWQLALGACTNVLVFYLGRRLFGILVGVVAAGIVLVSGPILVFELVLLRTTLTAFLTVLLLLVHLRALERPERDRLFLAGLVAGWSVLAQSYLVLFIGGAWIWLGWVHRGAWRARWAGVVALGLGFLVAVAPVLVRNARLGLPGAALASNSLMSIIPMNCHEALPLEPAYVHQPTLVRIMHESRGRLVPALRLCWDTFPGWRDRWRLLAQKLEGLFMRHEVQNNMNFYMYRHYAPVLLALPAPYAWVAPLGLVGFVVAWIRLGRRFPLLGLMVVVSAAPLFLSCSLARYRTPLVVLLSLLGAFLLVELCQALLQRRWRAWVASLALTALATAYTSRLPRKLVFPYFNSDFTVMYTSHFYDRLVNLEKGRNWEEYARLTGEMIGYLPPYFFQVRRDHRIRVSNEAESYRAIVPLLRMHAAALTQAGRPRAAVRYEQRATLLLELADEFTRRLARLQAGG